MKMYHHGENGIINNGVMACNGDHLENRQPAMLSVSQRGMALINNNQQ